MCNFCCVCVQVEEVAGEVDGVWERGEEGVCACNCVKPCFVNTLCCVVHHCADEGE